MPKIHQIHHLDRSGTIKLNPARQKRIADLVKEGYHYGQAFEIMVSEANLSRGAKRKRNSISGKRGAAASAVTKRRKREADLETAAKDYNKLEAKTWPRIITLEHLAKKSELTLNRLRKLTRRDIKAKARTLRK